MQFFRGLTRKKQSSSSASAERRKNEQDYYLKNGSSVLEELLALCDGNCRIPIRYFSAIEIERAIKHSESKMGLSGVYMVTGSLDNRPVLVRFNRCQLTNIHRDIAITAQMSHLKNVLRLVGCCLEFEEAVMVYEYVEGISLSDLLFKKGNSNRKSLSWGNRLRIANEVASAIVFLHTEFTTPIIHRDIAPSKVIIDQNNGVAKILDFSLSISLPPGKLEMKSEDGVLGTIGYIAPENGFYDITTQKIDVYSFGALLFELLTGKKMVEMVDSAISKEPIDCEEDNKSHIEKCHAMYTTFEKLQPNIVDRYVRENNVIDIVDPTIFEEHGIEIQ
ncbi:hypothetical protein H5410_032708 [Solanum commersonii]|uniref:Protein kinase domain-containing protein n=1 Tax=Solanum commersonii TaxID=4109 RepID=A0A9J5YLP7_SOLCO|nr:hypothetical protein H5410_032708 [Solanum commersonii]